MSCKIEINGLPVLEACPADSELMLFFNVSGESNGMALRTWATVKECIINSISVQKEPRTFVVGQTPDAPVAGTNVWVLDDFAGSWVVLFLGGIIVNTEDAGDGSPYTTKLLASNTLTIFNHGNWNNGDVISYILITP